MILSCKIYRYWYQGLPVNTPSRQNAPTDRVLTSVNLKDIEWAFRKVYSTKIPDMVHQGTSMSITVYLAVDRAVRLSILDTSVVERGHSEFCYFSVRICR